MILYSEKLSPNGRRVLMYLNEAGIELDTVYLDLKNKEHKQKSFLALNPFGTIPVLKVDEKKCITESVSICKYLEYTSAKTNLFGKGIDEKIETDMWLRKVEERVFTSAINFGHHTSSFFKMSKVQIPAYAEYCKNSIYESWNIFDEILLERDHICPHGFSFADITLYIGTNLAILWGLKLPSRLNNLTRWYRCMNGKSSTENVRYVM